MHGFAAENNLCFDDPILSIDSFTFDSPAHITTSWPDLVLFSQMLKVISSRIFYNVSLFDHFPIACDVKIAPTSNKSDSVTSGN